MMSLEPSSVYIATYSNTDVYECTVGDAPVMRRCKDNWVNATQILKLCDFPKAKRTKILEKGVQQGLHEKVQGGYGRFQGTWIPLEDAQKLAQEYEISADLVPVLYIDPSNPQFVISRKSKGSGAVKVTTPSKRKYVRKPTTGTGTPKKMKFDEQLPPQAVFSQEYVVPRSGPSQPPGPPQSHQAPPAPPSQIHGNNMPMPHIPMGRMPPQEYIAHEQSQNMRFQRPANYPPTFAIPDPNYQQQQHQHQNQHQNQQQQPQQPSQAYGKNTYSVGIEDMSHQQQMMYQQRQKQTSSHSTNETNWSQEEHTRDSDTSISSADPKGPVADEENSHVAQLLRFFSEDNAPIPYFLYNPPPNFNINEAIDDEGHSTLHWAASIGNLNLVHLLLSKGANPLVVSNFGLNPLSKCIAFNNCFDLKNFPHVVDALEMCLINTDINGRTPLHYLCQFSKVASKLPALSYYLDVIFKKLRMMSRNSGTGVDLIKNVIDHQDVNGDTCLHLASRARCTQLVKFFLHNGARDDLLDLNNQSAKALIMQLDLVVYNFDGHADKPYYGHPAAQRPAPPAPQIPTFQVTQSQTPAHSQSQNHTQTQTQTQNSHPAPAGLGTPIRGFSRLAETPDTQRTTIQDEEEEEVHDHVSKEHLKTLLDRQAGTVDDNKENIFVDEQAKTPASGGAYGVMSTPKYGYSPHHAPKNNVLGVISEKAPTAAESSAVDTYSPHPPRLDKNGHVVEISASKLEEKSEIDVKLPMKDVSSMVNGMMHSLETSYEAELSGLRAEQIRVKHELQAKRTSDKAAYVKTSALLEKHGFKATNSLEEAASEAAAQTQKYALDLSTKETQLQCSLGKWHAYELASLVEQHENKITSMADQGTESEQKRQWDLSLQLCSAQRRRVELASKLGSRIRDFAITTKMNKYRKLISMSCGLKVEDIDGLLEGIAASLNEGTT